MAYQFVIADRSTGAAIGEVTNAAQRTLTLALNRVPTAAFSVRLTHPFADQILSCEPLLLVYQDKRLRFCGDVIAVEESASADSGGSLRVTAAGALWRLARRIVGKTATGLSYGTAIYQVDRGMIAANVLRAANGDGDTGIRVGTITPSSTGYVEGWRYIPAADAITQLSATLDGYDFEIAPLAPSRDADGLVIGELNASGFIGQPRPEVIFEYATGRRNVATYTRPVTRDSMLNAGYNLPEGFPNNAVSPVVTSSDVDSIDKWGRMEGLVAGDVTVGPMRQRLVDEHVRVRRQPRQTITFEPARFAPRLGEYEVGDIVTARARIAGSTRFDALFRVYGVTIELSEEGAQTERLDLIPAT